MPVATRLLPALLLLASAALAQSGIALVDRPWPEGRRAAIDVEVESFLEGETDTGTAIRLRRYAATGRFRLDPDAARDPAAGFRVTYLDLDTVDPRLPGKLVDVSVGGAIALGEWSGWRLRGNAGIGYAGDETFGDSDAWYAIANLAASRRTDRSTFWSVYLNFNGNRTIFPDLPLPGFAWTRIVDRSLRFTLGFPYSSVDWVPADGWRIEASVLPFLGGSLRVTRAVRGPWSLFAELDSRNDAWHRDTLPDNRRLFLSRYHAEGGVRWEPDDGPAVELAAGFAFDRTFEVGWDVRNTSGDIDLSDELYVVLRAEFAF